MNAQAKTINLLLYDGNLQGVISIEDSSWNAGELYSAPRESVDELIKTDACKKYGVYLLLSQKMVYVGQASDLSRRINQHILGKEWWESVVILTTTNDSLTHADIDYLEYVLIERAFAINRLDCDNRKKGNPPKVDKFRKVYLGQYLEEALFLMQLIGINVYVEPKQKRNQEKKKDAPIQISTISATDRSPALTEKRSKSEVLQFVTKNLGQPLKGVISFASLQRGKRYCWANPKTTVVSTDWSIVLNDTDNHCLVILYVPAGSLNVLSGSGSGLKARSDRPDRIELKISVDTYIDSVSHVDFSCFVFKRINY